MTVDESQGRAAGTRPADDPAARTPPGQPASRPAATPTPTVEIDGRAYPVGRLTYADVCQFCVWARKKRPDAMAAIKPHLAGMPVESQKAAVEAAIALDTSPVLPGTPDFFEAVYSLGGIKELLAVAVRRGGSADVPREQTDAAVEAAEFAAVQRAVNHALGLGRSGQ